VLVLRQLCLTFVIKNTSTCSEPVVIRFRGQVKVIVSHVIRLAAISNCSAKLGQCNDYEMTQAMSLIYLL